MLQFCSKTHHLKDIFLYFYVKTIFEISGFTTKYKIYFVYASLLLLISCIWAHSHCFFPVVFTILFCENFDFFEGNCSFSLCIVMSENYTWREQLKANFQLNILENTSSMYYIFKQRAGTYLGSKIPHKALLKWRELKQVIVNTFYLELLQVTASNLFSTAECFLFATAILFIF